MDKSAGEIALAVLDAIGRGASSELSALLHDDVVWCTPRGTMLPTTMQGKRAVAVGFAPWFECAAGPLLWDEVRVHEAGACAIVEFTDHAEMKDGSRYEGEGVAIFEIRDGRVASIREHFNTVLFNAHIRSQPSAPNSVGDRDASSEIGELLARYCHALDHRDWPLLRSCFTADAQLTYDGTGTFDGFDAFEPIARELLGRCEATHHLLGSVRVLRNGDGYSANSYVQAYHRMTSGDVRITGGEYVDAVRWDGQWRISAREFRRTWGQGPGNGPAR